LGSGADVSANNLQNATAVGYNTILTASNQVRLGNNSVSTLFCKGADAGRSGGTYSPLSVWSDGQIGYVTSSRRYKNNITPIENKTERLYDLRPVSYTYKGDSIRSFGLIAEEVAEVMPELVMYKKASEVIAGDSSDKLVPETVHYEKLPVLMLNELQKHEKLIKDMESIIVELQKQNTEILKQNAEMKREVEALKSITISKL